MDTELLAEYGRASINLEIAQAEYNRVKQKVVEEINKERQKQAELPVVARQPEKAHELEG